MHILNGIEQGRSITTIGTIVQHTYVFYMPYLVTGWDPQIAFGSLYCSTATIDLL